MAGLIHNKFYLDKAAPKNKFDQCFTRKFIWFQSTLASSKIIKNSVD